MAKRTIQEAFDIYQSEGHGYAVEDYTGDVDTNDEELNGLWIEASVALQNLSCYFEDKLAAGEIE
jgi:hypothetical protein